MRGILSRRHIEQRLIARRHHLFLAAGKEREQDELEDGVMTLAIFISLRRLQSHRY